MPRRRPPRGPFAGRQFKSWQKLYDTPELRRQAENLPVRRDMVTVLTYVRDNKVVGTQSTGNMPLKAIRAVTAQFVNPPQLDATVGDHTYRLRTETDVWDLYFLHILAEVGGLLQTAPARRWRLTPQGKAFLERPALPQTAYLFTVWWNRVNWVVAYPVQGVGESLPPFFNVAALGYLQETCPVGQTVPFEEFADGLIEKTGLTWSKPDLENVRMILHGAVRRLVINILLDFEGVTCQYKEAPPGITKLESVELTKFGRALLDAAAVTLL